MSSSSIKLDNIKKYYCDSFERDSPVDGWIMNDGYMVRYNRCLPNLNKEIVFMQNYKFSGEANGFGVNLEHGCRMCINHEKNLLAVFRPQESSDKFQYMLEIWERQPKVSVKYLEIKGEHGEIYSRGRFFGMSWSRDNRYLAYVAESKSCYADDKTLFFNGCSKQHEKKCIVGDGFLYRDHWGETYNGGGNPSLFALDVTNGSVKAVPGIPSDISVGQVTFSPTSDCIVFTGWETKPYRMGIEHCFNRKSVIYCINFDSNLIFNGGNSDSKSCRLQPITSINPVSYSPRFSFDGSRLVYLTCKNLKAHKFNSDLYYVDRTSTGFSSESPIIDSESDSTVEFPGLYIDQLPTRPFINDYDIAISSIYGMRNEILIVRAASRSFVRLRGSLEKLFPDYHSFKVLDVMQNQILVTANSFDKSPIVACLQVDEFLKIKPFQATLSYEDPLEQLTFHEDFVAASDNPNLQIRYLTVHKNDSPNQPVILYCHGGPHSNCSVNFHANLYFLVKCGFSLVLPNYRGSLGFGRSYINTLLGKVGEMDVQDCISVMKSALTKYTFFDREKIIVMGGSHGGFLTCHLLSRSEFKWKAGVSINGVTNISSMEGTSDIPDWTFAETGCDIDDHVKWQQSHDKMYQSSPIRHIAKINAPLLIIAAKDDQRVPFSQSVDLYKKMTALNKKCKFLLYPTGGHAIANVKHASDYLMNVVLWLYDNLNISLV